MEVKIQNLTKKFGELTAVNDVSLTVNDGEFLTLVGPSGCGKSTMLRCITGLERPTSGRIMFGNTDVTTLSPQKRNVAMVFQSYALYPHMNARENMAFAIKDAGIEKREIERRISETAEMLGIADHLEKVPDELSGGQKQRVALGRSLVRDPDILLLDEPLSNLDAKLRIELRAELQKIHQEFETTTIYVTHDQEEAMTMSDRIAVLNSGEIQQLSPPVDAYNRPVNRFVANFIGSPSMNFFECSESNGQVTAGPLTFDRPNSVTDEIAEAGIRPEDLLLTPATEQAAGTVSVFEHIGPFNLLYVDVHEQDEEVVVQVPAHQYFEVGDTVELAIKDRRVHLFDAAGQSISNPTSHQPPGENMTEPQA